MGLSWLATWAECSRLRAHLWLLVLAPSSHSSGRGFGPRRSGGTLQLSTRCSSLALPPSRSLAVRVGWAWLASLSARGIAMGAANATSKRSVRATTWTGGRNITRGELGIGVAFDLTALTPRAASAWAGLCEARLRQILSTVAA